MFCTSGETYDLDSKRHVLCFQGVRPSVDYASSVWSPHSECHINQLEMAQRRAALYVKHDYALTRGATTPEQHSPPKWSSTSLLTIF